MTVVLDLDGVLTEHPRVLAAAASERFGVDLPERAFIDAAGLEISDEIRGWVYGVDGPAAQLAPAADAAGAGGAAGGGRRPSASSPRDRRRARR